ncbi:acetyl-CoA C-acetyltransferase [uncultured Desulfosarcina sp.]|uniref:thiolase family protein n=1 Tax=uncultured Desulfosarcina sp. TaxID=218289 RepID=UPI0029C7EB5C|nr:acetyl-CoA C-acetyltransferase [uncultured Desulfosarcina sp.]
MKEVVIVSAARTPIGTMGGSLARFRQRDLASIVMKSVLERADVSPDLVEDVFFGCCNNVQEDVNVARVGLLEAGLPDTIPGMTINRVCLSGMEAITSAVRKIQCGENEICIAGGVETMSNAPYYVKCARWGAKLRHQELTDSMWEGLHAGGPDLMGITAENVAEKYNVTRKDQDEAALRSHNNVERATAEGRFKDEIVPVTFKKRGKEVVVDKDEHFRPGMTMQQLEALPPMFKKDGTVTAGNASGINDGAAAVLIMSLEKANDLGLAPMARYVTSGIAGVEPSIMGISPVPATRQALERARMAIGDIQLAEFNEAFAAQYVACEKELNLNRETTNVNGSGIGLGHPVGCTGTRIVVTLIHEMIKRDVNVGMASLCGGGGIGMTTIWER